jgi:predicted ATP-dependent serine protease
VRGGAAMEQRLAAARLAGVSTVFAPSDRGSDGIRVITVRHVKDALTWASSGSARRPA